MLLFFAEIDEFPQTKIYALLYIIKFQQRALHVEHYCLHCEIKSGVNTKKSVSHYNNVQPEIRLFVLELFNCLRSEVRKCK